MSVEFRQKSIGEYVKILKRRKWLIVLPVITMAAAVGYVVLNLPNYYESKTLLTIKPPTISDMVVKSLTEEDLSQRLQTMQQEVLSRTSLEPMVVKYDLYKNERNAGMPMEVVIEKFTKKIVVEPQKDSAEKVASFTISYQDRMPEAARNVVTELASKFVNAQVIASTQNAETTRSFLDEQLNQAKQNLDMLDRQRLEVMQQNVETLPDSAQGLIAQLQGLRTREDTITKEKETLFNEKGRLNSQISSNNQQMRLVETFGERETQSAAKNAGQIEDTPAYSTLIQKRADLKGQLDKLMQNFKEKHPDVIAKKAEISRVNEELEMLKKNTDVKIANATESSSQKSDLQKKNLELENQRVQAQITQIEQQLQFKDQELQQNNQQISILEGKINLIPNVKVALEGVNSQYLSAKQTYDDFLKKRNDAQLQLERESSAKGETIQVVDAANLPKSPANQSKKPIFTLMGAMIGLALGLFFAAIFEAPRFFKIQNIADAKHYTGLPVIASVPPLLSFKEKTWKKQKHLFMIFAGVIIAVGLIPVVIMILQATKIFERLAA